MFNLQSKFQPIDEQQKATEKLSEGISQGIKDQVLLGVTGSGKTFTIANVIQKLNIPTLIISHNKTLAGQLYQEMRDFFPENAVSYFVSYYDYYQPEAYIPSSDTYIEKEAEINETIDKLRLASTSNILTRDDIVVVASVSCIYNIGSPVEYGRFILELKVGNCYSPKEISKRLVELQYDRSEFDFKRGSFRMRADRIDIYPAYDDVGYKLTIDGETLQSISAFDPLTGEVVEGRDLLQNVVIYPAKHYMTDPKVFDSVESTIRADLEKEYSEMKARGKILEAERLLKKVNYDLEMIKEMGYVNGIENYSRYFDGRKIGDPPYSLLDYYRHRFGNNWLAVIDESHMTVPQIRGMFNGDFARKQTLIDYGFRLKSAFDNRPLRFSEFYSATSQVVYVSATPGPFELEKAKDRIIEQLVRPTGVVEPLIEIRPAEGEVQDVIKEIEKTIEKGERVLVITLTKRIAEDLTAYLKERKIKAEYLHSDIKTLDRSEVLNKLRKKEIDVLIGINLLREGLDLPEVTLVAILDADNEGFLRSKSALIQLMGRAARNTEGNIIIYADKITKSIDEAVKEVGRRREYQVEYNRKHDIEPKTILKEIRDKIIEDDKIFKNPETLPIDEYLSSVHSDAMTPYDKKKTLNFLRKEMNKQAKDLHFEAAIAIREKIEELNK